MRLQPTERRLDGALATQGGRLVKDASYERIEWLIPTLERLGTDASGWDTLYRDPGDGRYWELVYLHSERHGGGPPSLICLSDEDVGAKYGIERELGD